MICLHDSHMVHTYTHSPFLSRKKPPKSWITRQNNDTFKIIPSKRRTSAVFQIRELGWDGKPNPATYRLTIFERERRTVDNLKWGFDLLIKWTDSESESLDGGQRDNGMWRQACIIFNSAKGISECVLIKELQTCAFFFRTRHPISVCYCWRVRLSAHTWCSHST